MDSREFSMKMDRLKELVSEKDYATALRIVEGIDWNRVKSASLLSLAASVYEENGRLEDAKDKLVLALERSGGGKRILYKLTELAVRSGNVEEATDYYNEYSVVAPDDPGCLLLQYMILKVKHAPYSQLIKCLELYNQYDPDEKWMYELATTYESAGRIQDAVNLCDRIAVMFGTSPYSVKALKLKQKYTKLTEEQRASLYPNSIASQGVHYTKEEPEYKVSMTERTQISAAESLGDRLAANRIDNEDLLFERYLARHDALTVDQEPAEPEEIRHITAENASIEELEALSEGRPVPVERVELPEEPEPEQNMASVSEPGRDPAAFGNTEPDPAPVNEGFLVVESEEEYPPLPIDESEEEYPPLPVDEPEELRPAAEPERPEVSVAEEVFAAKPEPVRIDLTEKEDPEGQMLKADARIADARIAGEKAEKAAEVIRPQARTSFTVIKAEEKPEVEKAVEDLPTTPLPKLKKKNVIGLHLIIEALDEGEGVAIAKKELQLIYQMRGVSRNVAKATAEKLNKLGNLGDVAEKIGDRDLVVVRAGDMEEKVAEQIYNMLTEESDRSIVLVDTPEGLDILEEMLPETFDICDILTDEDARDKDYSYGQNEAEIRKTPAEEPVREIQEVPAPKKDRKAGLIENGGNVPFKMPRRDNEIMEFEDFAQYCIYYANDKGCSISGKSLLALYEKIEIMEEEGIALTKEAAEDCIEEAADHAEHPGVKGAFRKKYDKDDMLILREEDFIN